MQPTSPEKLQALSNEEIATLVQHYLTNVSLRNTRRDGRRGFRYHRGHGIIQLRGMTHRQQPRTTDQDTRAHGGRKSRLFKVADT